MTVSDEATPGTLTLSSGQIEAHIGRLVAVKTGLEKYRVHDYRVAGTVVNIDAAIDELRQEAPPVGQFGPVVEPEPELEPEPSGWDGTED